MNRGVMILSNGPQVPSGYGIQAAIVGAGLKARGWKVSYSANYGVQGHIGEYLGDPVMPPIPRPSGVGLEALQAHVSMHCAWHGTPDVLDLILLYDSWAYHDSADTLAAFVAGDADTWGPPRRRLWYWCPFKRRPLPDVERHMIETTGGRPVPFHRWARDLLEEAGIATAADPIPHAVTDAYLVDVADDERAEARAKMGARDDQTLVLMVAANVAGAERKGFAEAFRAYARLREQDGDRWHMYLHTLMAPTMGGQDLMGFVRRCGVDGGLTATAGAQFVAGVPDELMRGLYAAADQLWMPSRCEGFGVPIIEAMAQGTPTLTTGLGTSGELVPPEHRICYIDAWQPQLQAWEAQADWRHLATLARKVGRRYRRPDRARALSDKARALYTEDRIAAAWADLLADDGSGHSGPGLLQEGLTGADTPPEAA